MRMNYSGVATYKGVRAFYLPKWQVLIETALMFERGGHGKCYVIEIVFSNGRWVQFQDVSRKEAFRQARHFIKYHRDEEYHSLVDRLRGSQEEEECQVYEFYDSFMPRPKASVEFDAFQDSVTNEFKRLYSAYTFSKQHREMIYGYSRFDAFRHLGFPQQQGRAVRVKDETEESFIRKILGKWK